MTFTYKNIQHTIVGGKKTTRKVIINKNKGYKSICNYRNGKKCHTKKSLSLLEIQDIKKKKFIPGLFNDIINLQKTIRIKH